MSKERLKIELEEPEDDPLIIQVFDILRRVLQLGTTLSVEDAASQISSALPEKTPDASDIGEFFCICYDVAEQIPFEHPSVIKLVTLIDLCIHTPKPAKEDGSVPSQNNVEERYGKLGETLRDHSNVVMPDRNPTRYLNFHAFVIRLDDCIEERRSVLPIFVLQDAFEDNGAYIETPAGRNACIKAALRYHIHRADAIHQEIIGDGKQEKWRIWHQQVQGITSDKSAVREEKKGLRHWLGMICMKADTNTNDDEKEANRYSSELLDLARDALVAMEMIDPCKPVKYVDLRVFLGQVSMHLQRLGHFVLHSFDERK